MTRPASESGRDAGGRARLMITSRIFAVVFSSAAAVSTAAARDAASDASPAPEIAVVAAAEPAFVLPPFGIANAAAFAQVVGQPAGPPPTPEHTGIKATAKEFLIDF